MTTNTSSPPPPPASAAASAGGSGGSSGGASNDAAAGQAAQAAAADWRAGLAGAHVEQARSYETPAALLDDLASLKARLADDRRVEVPKADAAAEAWAPLRKALGVPDAPEGYQVAAPDGAAVDPATLAGFQKLAHDAGLTPRQAEQLAQFHFTAQAQARQSVEQAQHAALTAAQAHLEKLWGGAPKSPAWTEKMAAARRGAVALGGPELLAQLEADVERGSSPLLLAALAKHGAGIADDRLPSGAGGAALSPAQMTPAQAEAELRRRMGADPRLKPGANPMARSQALAELEPLQRRAAGMP